MKGQLMCKKIWKLVSWCHPNHRLLSLSAACNAENVSVGPLVELIDSRSPEVAQTPSKCKPLTAGVKIHHLHLH